jgi:hypothetical protein
MDRGRRPAGRRARDRFLANRSRGEPRADDSSVADPIAPVVVELAIAFGDCDRPPTKR